METDRRPDVAQTEGQDEEQVVVVPLSQKIAHASTATERRALARTEASRLSRVTMPNSAPACSTQSVFAVLTESIIRFRECRASVFSAAVIAEK